MKAQFQVNQSDINHIFSWIKATGERTSGLWERVEPMMKEQVRREFSDENPNNWRALSPKYLQWKMEQGYPATIGVRKGFLKMAATDRAVIKKGKDYFLYSVNMGIASQVEGFDYFSDFNRKRKIFKHTQRYMNTAYANAVEQWINQGIEEHQ